MADTTLEAYLHQQSQLYQTLLHNITVLKQTIQHQENVKHNQTIPKQYLPHPLTTFGTTTSYKTFKKQYKDLFFQHLEKVLIHNQTTLELQQTKLTNIIMDTEHQLSTSTESTDQITLYYHQFMTNNNITNHQTLPSLKARLTNSATHTTSKKQTPRQALPISSTREQPDQRKYTIDAQPTQPTTQRKRKQDKKHPTATKRLKLHHFLGRSSQHNPAHT